MGAGLIPDPQNDFTGRTKSKVFNKEVLGSLPIGYEFDLLLDEFFKQ